MKITDIKPFVSTDRKVHVALTDGGSKDGYLSLARVTVASNGDVPVTVALVKGDRGRPATVRTGNIDSITWHSKNSDKPESAKIAEKIEKARKKNPLHSEDSPSGKPTKAVKPLKPVPHVTGKQACGCTGKLLCKAHYEERRNGSWINGGSDAFKATLNTMDGMTSEELMKVIQHGAGLLAKRTRK